MVGPSAQFGANSSSIINGTTTNYIGGNGFNSGAPESRAGGGGAGATANGITATYATGGAGGNGYNSSITGTSLVYGGGGGGGGEGGRGAGGDGGGGLGESGSTNNSTTGTVNTGGGGGGAGGTVYVASGVNGKAGGSGIVIIRYADTLAAATSNTGSPNVTVSGGYRTYRFWQSGSITF
jgi:hypothetical protein